MTRIKCKVDYFDSFKLTNRFDEPGEIIRLRADDTAVVEVKYPVRKRVIVPFNCIKVDCIS